MTPQREAMEKIAGAAQFLKGAADRWNAVDLSVIAQCISELEFAANGLSDAARILEGSSTASGNLFRSDLSDLTKSAFRLERLVGASAAFLRGAPGLTSEDPGLYQAGGSLCHAEPVSEMRGMQV